jgi:formylglycine-generating enzyme required for sulfatase activity
MTLAGSTTVTNEDFARAMKAQGYTIVGSSPEWFQYIWNEAIRLARKRREQQKVGQS